MLIDAHFHVFDPTFPLPGNDGYVPPPFTVADYQRVAEPLGIAGGVLVAASTHGLDPTPLLATLRELGPNHVAVLNANPAMTDDQLRTLAGVGVRGLRYNLYRDLTGSAAVMLDLARRARDVAGLHAQVYADAALLRPMLASLQALGRDLVIDHLGMTEAGLPVVLDLIDAGATVKATGFGRVSLDVPAALERIAARRDDALMFGTDLPSTRAQRPFRVEDLDLLRRVLGTDASRNALGDTAARFYALSPVIK